MARRASRSGPTPRALPSLSDLRVCCGMVNRGFAVLGDRLFMTTPDAHLIALDRYDRQQVVGVSSWGDYARRLRQHWRAADCEGQGDRRCRRWRVRHPRIPRRLQSAPMASASGVSGPCPRRGARQPTPGPPKSGSAAAVPPRLTGTYDPELNSLYWGHWQPAILTSTAPIARATTSTPTRSSHSMPTPAPSAGTSSSRRTTSTIGMPTRSRCWRTSR